ncbi:pentatricopeptide repeat-containing protein [Pyrus ussuriensis x Pyrus communis]|nr:pentatricopeptide repeat-containing protein [Pyrus ussuriensis x Pyrus communis]
MHSYFKQLHGFHKTSLSYYSRLIDHCLSLKSVNFVKIIHAQLIKVGFNSHTFLGNRCLDVYFRFGDTLHDALKVYDEITEKNLVSWNICLKGLGRFGEIQKARHMFAEMPERDVVSWNSMISGYVSCGFIDNALEIFSQMQIAGVRPSEYTFSIMMTLVTSACYGKQIHGDMIRSGMNLSNVVLGNSLIDMYGKLGCVDYAFGVFFTMEEVDVISWNSLISGCHRSGYEELALDQFFWMRGTEYAPDEFTISTVINVCCNLLDLEKGKQTFAFCFKVGFFSNSIVSSAAIDLLSKCNRLEDAIRLFEELDWWDSAVCNSMISSYAQHGCGEDAVQLFVLTLRENLRPTEFTLSSMLSSVSIFLPAEPGSQIHSLVVKLGFESDVIVASSLVDLYSKAGLVNYAMKIFSNMGVKDLITWNTIIMGLAHNGKVFETLSIFKELASKGAAPDNLTLAGVLLACNFGGFIEEGMTIFLTMEKEYGIVPGEEHYAPIVDLLCRAGKLREAMDVLAAMPYEHGSVVWESILRACVIHGDFKLTERVAKRMMKLVPQSSLPYLVLARAYEMRGKWESMIWVRKAMILNGVKNVVGCSWIGIQNHVYTFNAEELQPPRGKDIYLILRLLSSEMEAEDYTDNLTKVVLRR